MRALLISDDSQLNPKVAAIVQRSGYECRGLDIVPIDTAVDVASRVVRDVVILVMPGDRERGVAVLRDLRNTTPSVLVAIGPAKDPKFILHVLREGADDYLDQAELETELEATLVRLKIKQEPHEGDGRIVGLLAPSGGAGASTLAVNLAAVLAARHARTALLDLRLTAGDQTLLLDARSTHSLADVCRSAERMDRSMFEQSLFRHKCGVHLLAAPEKREDIGFVTTADLRKVLGMARMLFPRVVLDLDRTFCPEQLAAMVQTDLLLLVLRLDVVSLRNTQRALDYLHDMGIRDGRVQVVVNRYRQSKELSPRLAEQALGVKLFHYVPDDPGSANLCLNKGVPLVVDRPRARISRSLVALGEAVDRWQSAHAASPHQHNGHAEARHPPLEPPTIPTGRWG